MKDCEICGNEIDATLFKCPFCEQNQSTGHRQKAAPRGGSWKVLNIKRDWPTADQARDRLDSAVTTASGEGVRFLKIIHGYGSSGRGGVLRHSLRARLQYLERTGKIQAFIPGETFHGHDPATRQLLRQYPSLDKDHDYRRNNQGITIVLL